MTPSPSIKPDTLRHQVVVDNISLGKKGNGPAEFRYPTSVAILDGRAFVVDSWNHRVQVFDLPDWKFAFQFGGFFCPKWVEVVEAGEERFLLVVDTNNRRLTFHDSTGKQVAEFQTKYRRFPIQANASSHHIEVVYEDGFTETFELERLLRPTWQTKLQKPISLARDPRGFIYISDFGPRVVDKFDADGNFVCQVLGSDVLNVPGKMAMNGDDLLVTDRPANTIHIYNTANESYRRWPHKFEAPGVIGRAMDGNLWIGEYKAEPDRNGSVLSVFSAGYELIRSVRLSECRQPTAVAITPEHILVADQFERNVLIFDQTGQFLRNLRSEPYALPVWSVIACNGSIFAGTGPVVDLMWAEDRGCTYLIDFETASVFVNK